MEYASSNSLLILGDGGVGKTSLVRSLSGRAFNPESEATHGIEESYFDTDQDIGIMDFGGQQIYEETYKQTVSKLDSAVVLIAVDLRQGDHESRIDHWNSVLENSKKFIKHLILTRSDIYSGEINEKLIKEKYDFTGIHKTSSKNATGIQELREAINASFEIISDGSEESESTVSIIVQAMAEQLCRLIAKNPEALKNVEWRDLERLIATALEGLGFDVLLTPPAKDGGKDVIANCTASKDTKTYYIEIKHWRKGGRPGIEHISDFIQVNAKDLTDGGLFLSTSGYTSAAYDQISEIMRQNVRLGDDEKIISLCQRFTNKNGVWRRSTPLPDILYEDTIS